MTNEQKIVLDILTQINFKKPKFVFIGNTIYQLFNKELTDNWDFYFNIPNQWVGSNTVLNCRVIRADIPEKTIEIITKSEQWIIEN